MLQVLHALRYLMLADGTYTPITFTDIQPIVTAITQQFSVSGVAALIAAILGVGIGAVFLWWGGRKAVRSIMAAFKKGRASL